MIRFKLGILALILSSAFSAKADLKPHVLKQLIQNANCKGNMNYLFRDNQYELDRHCDAQFPIVRGEETPVQLLNRKMVLEDYWGTGNRQLESASTRTFLYLPRLLENSAEHLISILFSIGNRIWNLPFGIYKLINPDNPEKVQNSGVALLAESVLSPMSMANDLISDSIGFMKIPYATAVEVEKNTIVKVCTVNLLNANNAWPSTIKSIIPPGLSDLSSLLIRLATPAKHVGLFIENKRDTMGDIFDNRSTHLTEQVSESHIKCVSARKTSIEPIQVSLMRLVCTWHKYYNLSRYSLLADNCGSFVQRILNASGYWFDQTPNFGISTEIPVALDEDDRGLRIENEQAIAKAKIDCDFAVNQFRNLIRKLEIGSEIEEADFRGAESIILGLSVSRHVIPIAYLQLIFSALKGKNKASFEWILKSLNELNDLEDAGKTLRLAMDNIFQKDCKKESSRSLSCVKPEYQGLISQMLADLDQDALDLLKNQSLIPELSKFIFELRR